MKNNNILIVLLVAFFTLLSAETEVESKAEDHRNLKPNETKTPGSGAIIKSTVKDASDSDNVRTWTPKNYLNHSEENGLTTGAIGNTQSTTSSMPGSGVSLTRNPNAMTSESIKNDENLKNEPALTSFDENLLNTVIAETTSKDATSALFDSNIKCYITRDISFKYKCNHTLMVFGDSMNSDGIQAKRECESECFEQYEAVEIQEEGSIENIDIDTIDLVTKTQEELEEQLLETEAFENLKNIAAAQVEQELTNGLYNTSEYLALDSTDIAGKKELERKFLYDTKEDRIKKVTEKLEDEKISEFLDKEIVHEKVVDSVYVLNTISFKYDINEGKKAYFSISYEKASENNGVIHKAAHRMLLSGNGTKAITINEVVSKASISLFANEADVNATLSDIKLEYHGGEYICPHHQDLSLANAGNFAYICPSGKLKNITKGYKSYTICEDYGVVGDNLDGTFSKKESANAICKKNYSCKLVTSEMTTDILKEFREGCVLGQDNCDVETCKELRLSERTIVNENVFSANGELTPTIVNKNQIADVKRPRVLLREDLDFQTRSAEEMKDAAYVNMITENTFRVTKYSIGENTESSDAFAIGMTNLGSVIGSAVRSIYWIHKPESFNVDDTNKKFHAILEVIVGKQQINESNEVVRYKDKIYYVKMPGLNKFKAFARIQDWGKNSFEVNENGVEEFKHSDILTSSVKFESFNKDTKNWYSHSSSLILEHFKKEKIDISEKYSIRIPVVKDVANMLYYFPGVVKSISKNGPYTTKVFDGKYDGTGETVQKVSIYTFVKNGNENITYQQIYDKINNEEIKPIYDSLAFNSYPQEVKDDAGNVNDDIQIYMYGKKEKMTGYTRIFPKKSDVGKKGFVYIFAINDDELESSEE